MKVKKSDFGYNLDNIKDAEQKSFMDNILGAMCDVVNKANDGLITKEDMQAQFEAINEKLKNYDSEKFDQVVKDNEELREMLKKSMDVIAKAQKSDFGHNVISKFDERLNEMFDSEKFQDFVEGRTRKSGSFDGFSMKDIVSVFANENDPANYTGNILISQQDQRYFSPYNNAKLHLRDVLPVLQGDPQYPTYTFGQVDSVDRNVRYVTENGELPESSISLKEVTANVVRLGTHIKVSKRMLKSRIFLRSFLLATLPDRIFLAEDWNILFGDGTGDNLKGIANQNGCTPVEDIISNAIVTIAAGGVSSVTSYNGGHDVVVEFTNPQPDIIEGMKITFAGATKCTTANASLNATHDVIKMNDRQILVKGVTFVSGETPASISATVNHGAFKSIDDPNSADVVNTIFAVMNYAQYSPTAIVMNPITVNAIMSEKDTTGRNLGLVTGTSGVKYINGVPVIELTSIPAGKYLVGDFRNAANLIDYTSLSLEWAEDVNTKLKNYVALIAQEEVIFPVYMPWAFAYGSLASVKTAITAE
jgi:HK97 family phage major capsid protein